MTDEELERMAENIMRDKCVCSINAALTGVKHMCFVCEITNALRTVRDSVRRDAFEEAARIAESHECRRRIDCWEKEKINVAAAIREGRERA